MAVGDFVIMTSGSLGPSTFAPTGPLMGRVLAEAGGPPATADVEWENHEQTLGIDQTNLRKVFFGGGSERYVIAKWLQLKNYPFSGAPPNVGEKSPAAAGIGHRAFGIGAYDAVARESAFVVMSWFDGRVKAMVPVVSDAAPAVAALSDCVLVQNRKNVAQK